MLGRRGHIATWMVFIGAIVLVITAITTFASFQNDFNEKARALQESYYEFSNDFYYVHEVFPLIVSQSAKKSSKGMFLAEFKKEIKKRAVDMDGISDLSGNFFGKMREGDYKISDEGSGVYEITMTGVFVKPLRGLNKIYSSFDLCVRFNEEGLISQCL